MVCPRKKTKKIHVWTRKGWKGSWKVRIQYLTLSCSDTTYGLCRGGAKRHRKILRDNIQGITKPVCHLFTVFTSYISLNKFARPFVVSLAVVA